MWRLSFFLLVVLGGATLLGCGGSAASRPLSAEEQQQMQQRADSVQKEEWDRHVQMMQKSEGGSPKRPGTK